MITYVSMFPHMHRTVAAAARHPRAPPWPPRVIDEDFVDMDTGVTLVPLQWRIHKLVRMFLQTDAYEADKRARDQPMTSTSNVRVDKRDYESKATGMRTRTSRSPSKGPA